MRYMLIVRANEQSESGVLPTEEEFAAMGRYNEELVRAGVLLAAEGLHPSAAGARVRFGDGRRTVIDGPFTETKELIAGFWLIQARSLEEAIEWVKRCPFPTDSGAEIEIRRVHEAEDLGPGLTPELREAEQRLRDRIATNR